ncbi:MAG: helix-turn-helix domain-containing protein [Bacillota bacterium]
MIKLKELREQKELSQQGLARKAGVAQSSIHYIETGQKSPTIKVLAKIAAALNVNVSDLIESGGGYAAALDTGTEG